MNDATIAEMTRVFMDAFVDSDISLGWMGKSFLFFILDTSKPSITGIEFI